MLFKNVKTFDEAYDCGYSDGESSATADLNAFLDTLNLPFDEDEMTEFEAVGLMADMLKVYMKGNIDIKDAIEATKKPLID
jgi:hypothetical protein